MRIPRIYQQQTLQLGQSCLLDRQASHYVKDVLRMQTGQAVEIFNGHGGEYQASIVKFQGKIVELCLEAFQPGLPESSLKITLAQAISRGEKMDFTLQKAVELGVHAIVPLLTERVGVKLDKERAAARLEHWQKIVVSACEQSGRVFVPAVSALTELVSWLQTAKADLKLILNPHEAGGVNVELPPAEVILLVGPEGGFTPAECTMAHRAGFASWQLGPRILRTETAGMSAIALLQGRWGDILVAK